MFGQFRVNQLFILEVDDVSAQNGLEFLPDLFHRQFFFLLRHVQNLRGDVVQHLVVQGIPRLCEGGRETQICRLKRSNSRTFVGVIQIFGVDQIVVDFLRNVNVAVLVFEID